MKLREGGGTQTRMVRIRMLVFCPLTARLNEMPQIQAQILQEILVAKHLSA